MIIASAYKTSIRFTELFEVGYRGAIITLGYFCFCASTRGPVTHMESGGLDDYGGGTQRF